MFCDFWEILFFIIRCFFTLKCLWILLHSIIFKKWHRLAFFLFPFFCNAFFCSLVTQTVVPHRVQQMEEAIRSRDFASFAMLTCSDSNQFHAVCLDTSPPIFYMNDTSHRHDIISFKYESFLLDSFSHNH